VPYSLDIHRERVTNHIRDYPGLSRHGRVKLFANLHSDLRMRGDFYRQDPERRVAPGTDYFWYQFLLRDDDGDGRIRHFSFVVGDGFAQYGILSVELVFIDEGA